MKQSSGTPTTTAEGSVLDVAGFVAGFAEDGVINLGWSGQGKRPAGQEQVSYRASTSAILYSTSPSYTPMSIVSCTA
jgi:hypothetical protein